LDQQVKGKPIAAGASIVKGTVVDLTVGKGLSDEQVEVPCLYGLTRRVALVKLMESSLSIGAVGYDNPKDSLEGMIYKQIPACGKGARMNMGESIDLYFTTDKTKLSAIADTTGSSIDEEDTE
jgi:beta-lactam-binding protein with PASTA domain